MPISACEIASTSRKIGSRAVPSTVKNGSAASSAHSERLTPAEITVMRAALAQALLEIGADELE